MATAESLQECSLVKQMVDAEWELLMFQEFQTWLIRTAMANDVLVTTCRSQGAKRTSDEVANKIPRGVNEESPALNFSRRGCGDKIRRAVFAAVAGDPDAIAFVEQEIGPGRVAIGPQTAKHFEPAFPAHQFADRAINARIAWRDAAESSAAKTAGGAIATEGVAPKKCRRHSRRIFTQRVRCTPGRSGDNVENRCQRSN